MAEHKRKLLDQVRDVIRLKHYSIRAEETYVMRIRRFILFHKKRHQKIWEKRRQASFRDTRKHQPYLAKIINLFPSPECNNLPFYVIHAFIVNHISSKIGAL